MGIPRSVYHACAVAALTWVTPAAAQMVSTSCWHGGSYTTCSSMPMGPTPQQQQAYSAAGFALGQALVRAFQKSPEQQAAETQAALAKVDRERAAADAATRSTNNQIMRENAGKEVDRLIADGWCDDAIAFARREGYYDLASQATGRCKTPEQIAIPAGR